MLEAQGTARIDTRQMVLLLFVCRAFTLMAFVPQTGEQVGGSTVIAAAPVSLIFYLLILIPVFHVLKTWGGRDILDCAYQQNRWLGRICAFFAWLFCIYQCLYTLYNQDIFLTSTIYTRESSRAIMFILSLAALYMARLGLESFSRLSLGIFIAYLVLLTMVIIAVAPDVDPLNLRNPFEDGAAPLFLTAARSVAVNGEIAAIVLLAPLVRGNLKKPCIALGGMWMTAMMLLAFATLTVLGDFARTQMFPVYTLTTVAEFFMFERMDAFHMAAWTFMGLIKTALYLYLAARCMRYLLRGKAARWSLGVNGLIAVSVSTLIAGGFPMETAIATLSVYPTSIIVLLIPGVIWLAARGFKKGKRYGES